MKYEKKIYDFAVHLSWKESTNYRYGCYLYLTSLPKRGLWVKKRGGVQEPNISSVIWSIRYSDILVVPNPFKNELLEVENENCVVGQELNKPVHILWTYFWGKILSTAQTNRNWVISHKTLTSYSRRWNF